MPSKKGQEQALTWLKSKATDKNTLDGINAELCINVIMDLQRQCDKLGSMVGAATRKPKNDILLENGQITIDSLIE